MNWRDRDTGIREIPEGTPHNWKLRDDAQGWTPKLSSSLIAGGKEEVSNVHVCSAATTENITLVGKQTIDGKPIVDGDKVLVWKQSTYGQNGVYTCRTAAWTLEAAFDLVNPVVVWVIGGATYYESIFGVTETDTAKPAGAYYK